MRTELCVLICLVAVGCAPWSSFESGRLTLVARDFDDRDAFDLETHRISTDWRNADLYPFVRSVTSLVSEQGNIFCEKPQLVSRVEDVPTSTDDCVWTRSLSGGAPLLARDRSGGLHRILMVDAERPKATSPGRGWLVMDISRVE